MSLAPPRESLIDEFGDLSQRIALFRPIIERHKALKAEIESWHSGSPPGGSYALAGDRYQVQVGPREWVRKIVRMDIVYRLLGKERFLQACTFPLGKLDVHLSDAEQAKVVDRARSGSRDVRSVALEVIEPANVRRVA